MLYRIFMLPTSGDMHSKLIVIVIIICDSHTTAQAHMSDNTMSAPGICILTRRNHFTQ